MDAATVLREHAFFGGLEERHIDVLARCASHVTISPNDLVFRQGTPASSFFVILRGRVAIEQFNLQLGPVTIQTLGPGEVVGWSWMVAPHAWRFDGRALERVEALALDGSCLRPICDEDPALGYQLMSRFAAVIARRLEATRLQLAAATGLK